MKTVDIKGLPDIDPMDFMNRHTLIHGEINTGKTTLTARILEALRRRVGDRDLAVLDLAPVIPLKPGTARGFSGVGGRLLATGREGDLLYLHPRLVPPRLSSSTEEEAAKAARNNLAVIRPLLDELVRNQRPILLVNDITLYLQAGSAMDLVPYLSEARTVVANGYFGNKLGTGALSGREKQQMQALMTLFPRLITLTGLDQPAVLTTEDEQ